MEFGPDWLANLFLFLFLFGLLFTVASLLLGIGHVGGVHASSGGGHGLHIDVGGHHVVGSGQHGAGAEGPGVLNMPTIMAAITWLGGVGYIVRHSLNAGGFLSVTVSLLSALLGGSVMFFLLARLLWPMMSKPLSSTDYSLPGTSAKVVSSIREGGVGEIVYVKDGSHFTAGARSEDQSPIEKGKQVVIIRYEHGLAYVRDVEATLNSERGEMSSPNKAHVS